MALIPVCLLLSAAMGVRASSRPPIPTIANAWWNITSTPNLGKYNSKHQQPVDFAVWQATDGTYQLESCIRNTNVGGESRLLYRWQSDPDGFFKPNWTPVGISMIANASYGETPGGLQAPHVTRWNGVYHKFYGTWEYIAQATSTDGKASQSFAEHLVVQRKCCAA